MKKSHLIEKNLMKLRFKYFKNLKYLWYVNKESYRILNCMMW